MSGRVPGTEKVSSRPAAAEPARGGRAAPGMPQEAPALRKIFVVGCQRSGTTWLQLLLAQHDSVWTARETNVFSRYLADLQSGWDTDRRGRVVAAGPSGTAALLGEDEFWTWARRLPDLVFQRIRGGRDHVDTVVEKTPDHIRHLPLMLELYPDAYFLHIIRDPRSVVSSLVQASRSWGRTWASQNPIDEAERWTRLVAMGRAFGTATKRYREVRYERLLEDTAGELAEVLAWVGLPQDRAMCERIAEACRLDRVRSRDQGVVVPWSAESDPKGFYRKGEAEGWRHELSRSQVRRIEYIAGDLMAELGYERTSRTSRRPLRLMLRQGLEWRLKRFTEIADQLLARL